MRVDGVDGTSCQHFPVMMMQRNIRSGKKTVGRMSGTEAKTNPRCTSSVSPARRECDDMVNDDDVILDEEALEDKMDMRV